MRHQSLFRISCTVFFIVLATSLLAGEIQFPEKWPAHPRLFLTRQRENELKKSRKSDALLEKQIESLLKKAEKIKNDPVTDYRIPDGKRLLGQSRRSIERVTTLAFAFRMTGQKEYAAAAIDELLAISRFKDWNPKHYLDVAEMSFSAAVGYDWLYDVLSAEQRKEIRTAIVGFAFDTALPLYEKQAWWVQGHNNWNEVCNGGLLVAALALADEEREKAEKIILGATKSLPSGLKFYQPDGAYPEGPGYWNYGGTYSGLAMMGLKDVFGEDFGLSKSEGFNVTGDYYMHVIGPIDKTFNYADGGESGGPSPMMFMLSQTYNRPDYALWLRHDIRTRSDNNSGRFAVFYAIWYDPQGSENDSETTPLAKKFRGVQDIAMMRTAWNDPNAGYVGFKAGNNKASHGHLDVGSFVYDFNGERWASDLGGDDYNMPGYFGKQRWTYFRLNNRSHNTLVIGDQIQNPNADCKLIEFKTGKELGQDDLIGYAVADMSAAYEGQARSARRTLTLLKNGQLIIEDKLEGVSEPVRWGMMTSAGITVDGKKATLSKKTKKSISLDMISAESGPLEILSADPGREIENRNKGFSLLASFADPKDGKVSFRVIMGPENN